MARLEKTVFISYRRNDVYTALAVYENLKNQGYDVFFDYRSISSGDFEQIISGNIRARAHFLLILTPTALDHCNEPGDWLRREIELAMDEKRNIIPLFFKGFRFGAPSVSEKLTGKLKNLSRYNGLNVHEDYFDEAMQRLRTQYLNIPLDTVLHPVSTEVQRVVREEQVAADKALEQIEDVKELVRQPEEKTALESQAIQYELMGDFWNALQTYYKIKRIDPRFPRVDIKIRELERKQRPKPVPLPRAISWRLLGLAAGGLLVIAFLIWGASKLLQKSPTATPESTQASQANVTFTSQPEQTKTLASTETSIPPTPTLGIGSTMIGKDGMTLLYVPAGEFIMGSDHDDSDEKPVHTVTLDAFWIDQTEVTNAMYAKCVGASVCKEPISKASYARSSYYGNSEFDNYPVIYVDWSMANTYCEWVDRRLPTEAEWEKAARGESVFVYPWGNDFDGTKVNFCDKNCSFDGADKSYDDGFAETAPVGSYPNGASPYGALDMAGNVWEWVNDWYDVYPGGDPNASSDFGQQLRVQRGGAFYNDAGNVRSATRWASAPTYSENNFGFRCAGSQTEHVGSTPTPQTVAEIPSATQTSIPSTQTATSPTSKLGIGSTRPGKDGMTLLYVPASQFAMGSGNGQPDEKPVHIVYLDAFWIDKTEVTNAMYVKCVQNGKCSEPSNTNYYNDPNYANYPVVYVSWNDANSYCVWADRRLPTEAEWEKAARGENAFTYPWGNDAPDNNLLNYNNAVGDATEVDKYRDGASPYGALNMAGNVWEWVADWYDANYYATLRENAQNPLGPASGQYRVVRGGSWINVEDSVRSADRFGTDPTYTDNGGGFRCATSATP